MGRGYDCGCALWVFTGEGVRRGRAERESKQREGLLFSGLEFWGLRFVTGLLLVSIGMLNAGVFIAVSTCITGLRGCRKYFLLIYFSDSTAQESFIKHSGLLRACLGH